MKVLRTVQMKVSSFEVGDTIKVNVAGTKYTATAQQVTDRGTLFFMDDCIMKAPMNSLNTNEGGYGESDLRKALNTMVLPMFPEKLKKRMVPFENGDLLSIPTYGQVFGRDTKDEWDKENIEIDDIVQLPLMKERKNRISNLDGDWCWYWLQNPLKKETSSTYFADVVNSGGAYYYSASNSGGVRPAFLIA